MSGLLFWMIFIQVVIFCIGASLLIAWMLFDRAEKPGRSASRNRVRVRRPIHAEVNEIMAPETA